jgi:hypothetical protein
MSLAHVKAHVESIRREQLVEEMFPFLTKIIISNKNGGMFNEPLDWRPDALNLPDYRKIIESPMDFNTIKSRLLNAHYSSKSGVIADVRLVFNNAKKYNPPAHPVHKVITMPRLHQHKTTR